MIRLTTKVWWTYQNSTQSVIDLPGLTTWQEERLRVSVGWLHHRPEFMRLYC